jgi:XRE family transcriptional regulator, fatty acid utilization regulator
VRQVRLDQGLTVDTLAERSSVSSRTIAYIESGQWNPRLDIIESLAQALGVPLSELVSHSAA